jgi:hypothetical protein
VAAGYQTPANGAKDSPPTDPGNAFPPVAIEAVNARTSTLRAVGDANAAIEAGKRDVDATIDSLEDH